MSDIPGTVVTTHDDLRALHPRTHLLIHPVISVAGSLWSAQDMVTWADSPDFHNSVVPAVVMIDGHEYDAHRDALRDSKAYKESER